MNGSAEKPGAEADKAEADESQPEEDVAEAQQPAAEASEAGAELEELVVAQDENGDAAALEDLDENDYDGFLYKLEDDVTKQEVKEMETAIDELSEDPESGEG